MIPFFTLLTVGVANVNINIIFTISTHLTYRKYHHCCNRVKFFYHRHDPFFTLLTVGVANVNINTIFTTGTPQTSRKYHHCCNRMKFFYHLHDPFFHLTHCGCGQCQHKHHIYHHYTSNIQEISSLLQSNEIFLPSA